MSQLETETFTEVEHPMATEEIELLVTQLPDWELVSEHDVPKLTRRYTFENFLLALDFCNAVGSLAEECNHHPLMSMTWGVADIQWWTHSIQGLHRNDFIMAAQTEALYRKRVSR